MLASAKRLLVCVMACLGMCGFAPAQTCNCTCDATLPPCQAITRFFMNESGGSPQAPNPYLTAGTTAGSVEVRHANRISIAAGTTITHVCVALKNPTGPTANPCAGGDTAYIFIAAHDPVSGLPGAFLPGTQTNFIVAPCVGLAINHQLVAFTTPVQFTSTADVWVGVGYPTAQDNIGHQGTRPRTGGTAAVWIGGTLSTWFNYEDPTLPIYNGRAPIIRALELARGNGRVDVSPVVGLTTSEFGTQQQFQVVLTSAPPTSPVTIELLSSNPAEGLPHTPQLVFDASNWNIPQTVTVTGQDDPLPDGTQPYQIITTARSTDACYNGVPVDDVQLTNIDNDTGCPLLWTRIQGPGPLPRQDHAMTFDPVRNRVVLFGGQDFTGAPLADLWEFDPANNAWLPIPAPPGPAPRFAHAMAYSPQLAGVHLSGGTDGVNLLNDCWSWNGVAWSPQPTLPTLPRKDHAATLDSAGVLGVCLLGGEAPGMLALPEAWSFLPMPTGWTPLAPLMQPAGPQHRTRTAAAFDPGSSGFVLHGGTDLTGGLFDDTWAYAAGSWTNVSAPPTLGPGVRTDHAMAFLPTRNSAVLYGGSTLTSPRNDDTWLLDAGRTWSQASVAPPPGRRSHAMTSISGFGDILLFGGESPTGPLGDTWRLSDPTIPTVAGPMDTVVQTSTSFTLGVSVFGAGQYAYQWSGPSGPLVDGPRISGSQSPTLMIQGAMLSDSGPYTVTVASLCSGIAVSTTATVDVNCTADFNNDNLITVQDIFNYLNAWFANDPRADINGGGLSVQDIFDFLNLWFVGCP